nr:enoyl-CoA hydratase/isomerase family protein [Marinicella sp. W31]MDC2878536.1 enoyl-CoA hydratase/isomerase family protein [Marinicella sp. W31]
MTNVMTIDHRGPVAVVTVDNPPVNALSNAVRAALMSAVDTLDADDAVKAVVLACAGRTFIAGADVREFNLPPEEPHLPDVVAAIEDANKPWTAAIHGSALGGGFEIALGCRFRIADTKASVGLPEVTLGLIPGASGTVRTPRLAGVETAVKLAVSGRPIKAKAALEAGLIDAVAENDLLEEAVSFAEQRLEAPLSPKTRERSIVPPADDFWANAKRTRQNRGIAHRWKRSLRSALPWRTLSMLRWRMNGRRFSNYAPRRRRLPFVMSFCRACGDAP